jgi:starch synthase (maltosyl-transferring)
MTTRPVQSPSIPSRATTPTERPPNPIVVENIYPELDAGRFPVKRTVGDILEVSADIFKHGSDVIRASLRVRKEGERDWSEVPMSMMGNDRWRGSFALTSIGEFEFTIQTWTDRAATDLFSMRKDLDAGEDVSQQLRDFKGAVEETISRTIGTEREELSALYERGLKAGTKEALELFNGSRFLELLARNGGKKDVSACRPRHVIVDRIAARMAAWYEMFPRSQGRVPGKSGTFKDCEARLDDIAGMGFDVVYLPPIHPIGVTNRRGRNNSPKAEEGDPGSPWAIGSRDGGHRSVDPNLGTIEDFVHFLGAAKARGIEVALDLAFQCSPDHPYVDLHPEWFFLRGDGSIKYAENPPKRYFDIYPLNFENEDWKQLWEEALDVVKFWIDKGVTTFRVDNPHTKPLAFWGWLIKQVKGEHPEVIFLAEAFTRPKVMKRLAKEGFSESYTYFTWRNTKSELTEFVEEYLASDIAEYFRGNLFTNTPDILSEYLQKGGRPAFKVRAVLAATLSSLYGIYSGYELCEGRPVSEGSEEYMDSEKYQLKEWDWDRPGNIKEYITKLNAIRRENRALHSTRNIRVLGSTTEAVFFYGKWTADASNVILVAVNLDPAHVQESMVSVPIWELGIAPSREYVVEDLVTGARYRWKGETNYVKLDPNVEPAHVFRVTG